MLKAAIFLLAVACVTGKYFVIPSRPVPVELWVAFVVAEIPTIWLEGRQPEDASRIIKGVDANDGEFPYQISLRKKGVNPGHLCGGSILTSNWVLTAAHCCSSMYVTPPSPRPSIAKERFNMVSYRYSISKSDYYIYAGSVFLNQGGSSHPVEKVIIHPYYQPTQQFINDVCLIRVSQPFKYSDKVQQVTLVPKGEVVNSGDPVTIQGWGYTNPVSVFESGGAHAALQKQYKLNLSFRTQTVKPMSRTACRRAWISLPCPRRNAHS